MAAAAVQAAAAAAEVGKRWQNRRKKECRLTTKQQTNFRLFY